MREPDAAAEGNVTAAVMVDLPLAAPAEPTRLSEIASATRRLRTPSRALASRFVMQRGLALVPNPLALAFARTVYGRRFFHGIVSNMPGPPEQLALAGVPVAGVVPVLPLAPGAPFAIGALGWHGSFGVGVATDPLVMDADELCSAMTDVVLDLARSIDHRSDGDPQFSARNSRARASGSSMASPIRSRS